MPNSQSKTRLLTTRPIQPYLTRTRTHLNTSPLSSINITIKQKPKLITKSSRISNTTSKYRDKSGTPSPNQIDPTSKASRESIPISTPMAQLLRNSPIQGSPVEILTMNIRGPSPIKTALWPVLSGTSQHPSSISNNGRNNASIDQLLVITTTPKDISTIFPSNQKKNMSSSRTGQDTPSSLELPSTDC